MKGKNFMSFTVKIKYTRPNTDVLWYGGDPSHYAEDHDATVAAIENDRRSGGKLISGTSVVSDNGLELTTTAVWSDEASMNAHWGDSRVQSIVSARNTYNTSNSISRTILPNEET